MHNIRLNSFVSISLQEMYFFMQNFRNSSINLFLIITNPYFNVFISYILNKKIILYHSNAHHGFNITHINVLLFEIWMSVSLLNL